MLTSYRPTITSNKIVKPKLLETRLARSVRRSGAIAMFPIVGGAQEPTDNKERIFATGKHTGEVVEGCLRVGAANAFVER